MGVLSISGGRIASHFLAVQEADGLASEGAVIGDGEARLATNAVINQGRLSLYVTESALDLVNEFLGRNPTGFRPIQFQGVFFDSNR